MGKMAGYGEWQTEFHADIFGTRIGAGDYIKKRTPSQWKEACFYGLGAGNVT